VITVDADPATASACSEQELEIVKQLVDMVNKKFNTNVKIMIKKKH
jgi:hypothetical protein